MDPPRKKTRTAAGSAPASSAPASSAPASSAPGPSSAAGPSTAPAPASTFSSATSLPTIADLVANALVNQAVNAPPPPPAPTAAPVNAPASAPANVPAPATQRQLTDTDRRHRIDALRARISPHLTDRSLLETYLEVADWDGEDAFALWNADRENILRGTAANQDSTTLSAMNESTIAASFNAIPEHERRDAALAFRLHFQSIFAGENLSRTEAILYLHFHRWDLGDAHDNLSNLEGIRHRIGDYDRMRTPLPEEVDISDLVTTAQQDERLAEFISITGRPDWWSHRVVLQGFAWDLIAAISYWFLEGVPPYQPENKEKRKSTKKDPDGKKYEFGLRVGINERSLDWPTAEQCEAQRTAFMDDGWEAEPDRYSKPDTSGDASESDGDDSDESSSDDDNTNKGKKGKLSAKAKGKQRAVSESDEDGSNKGKKGKLSTKAKGKQRAVSESDEDDSNKGKKGKKSFVPKGEGFLLAVKGDPLEPAYTGCPDPSKFLIETISRGKYAFNRFRQDGRFIWPRLNQNTQRRTARASTGRVEFDWNDPSHIQLLNNWRRQALLRTGPSMRHDAPQPWSREEDQFLIDLTQELHDEMSQDPDWTAGSKFRVTTAKKAEWKRRFNKRFTGTTPPGADEPRTDRTEGAIMQRRGRIRELIERYGVKKDEGYWAKLEMSKKRKCSEGEDGNGGEGAGTEQTTLPVDDQNAGGEEEPMDIDENTQPAQTSQPPRYRANPIFPRAQNTQPQQAQTSQPSQYRANPIFPRAQGIPLQAQPAQLPQAQATQPQQAQVTQTAPQEDEQADAGEAAPKDTDSDDDLPLVFVRARDRGRRPN
ncbi:uncharacterized protein A1O5_13115 [Cladophialophora psammophila CBS 110553]|uniref:Myb-like domain-containing protein n=1 Tax=Cladophialophora psammophila CBS 110553 TaxID=1182543 RepID=W9VDW3_9EURO|nr:uncharacterized protein A1O5_13115 [Cladophialophora psammophila CBS 110553]EXJ53663.1 hypothetical protein A1O5_13115 [Cladophialophora psammophila CBS 110553]